MAAFLSIHGVKHLAASTVQGGENHCSPHLTLDFEGESFENRGAITLYIGDTILNARLIEAINNVVKARREEIEASEKEQAA